MTKSFNALTGVDFTLFLKSRFSLHISQGEGEE